MFDVMFTAAATATTSVPYAPPSTTPAPTGAKLFAECLLLLP